MRNGEGRAIKSLKAAVVVVAAVMSSGFALGLCGGPASATSTASRVPDVRGVSYDSAQHRLGAHGWKTEDYDAAADNNRHAFADEDWVVAVQAPRPGSYVRDGTTIKLGRVKKVEVEHLMGRVTGSAVYGATATGHRPTRVRLVEASVHFCDRLVHIRRGEHARYQSALTQFAHELTGRIEIGLPSNDLRATSEKSVMVDKETGSAFARAAARPASEQFCSDQAPLTHPHRTTPTTHSTSGQPDRERAAALVWAASADPYLDPINAGFNATRVAANAGDVVALEQACDSLSSAISAGSATLVSSPWDDVNQSMAKAFAEMNVGAAECADGDVVSGAQLIAKGERHWAKAIAILRTHVP